MLNVVVHYADFNNNNEFQLNFVAQMQIYSRMQNAYWKNGVNMQINLAKDKVKCWILLEDSQ